MFILINLVSRRVIGAFFDVVDADEYVELHNLSPDDWQCWYMEEAR